MVKPFGAARLTTAWQCGAFKDVVLFTACTPPPSPPAAAAAAAVSSPSPPTAVAMPNYPRMLQPRLQPLRNLDHARVCRTASEPFEACGPRHHTPINARDNSRHTIYTKETHVLGPGIDDEAKRRCGGMHDRKRAQMARHGLLFCRGGGGHVIVFLYHTTTTTTSMMTTALTHNHYDESWRPHDLHLHAI